MDYLLCVGVVVAPVWWCVLPASAKPRWLMLAAGWIGHLEPSATFFPPRISYIKSHLLGSVMLPLDDRPTWAKVKRHRAALPHTHCTTRYSLEDEPLELAKRHPSVFSTIDDKLQSTGYLVREWQVAREKLCAPCLVFPKSPLPCPLPLPPYRYVPFLFFFFFFGFLSKKFALVAARLKPRRPRAPLYNLLRPRLHCIGIQSGRLQGKDITKHSALGSCLQRQRGASRCVLRPAG